MSVANKASCNQSVSIYPMNELMTARNEFRNRWNREMSANPLARLINTDHHRYPPNTILKNCERYPFSETDKCQLLLTMSDEMRSEIIMNSEHIPSEIYDYMISEADFQHIYSRLSNKVCMEYYMESITSNQCVLVRYFMCDICDFLGTNEEDALEHLKQAGHPTCSKYIPVYYVDSFNAKPCQLEEPRVIMNQRGRIYGWSVGDSVICCPTCNLTFPDKLMCAYHHYLQHPESEPLYTYGKVLIVQELKLHRSLICSNCQVQLSTVKHMTTRCGNSTWCYSSFFYSLYCQMISSSRLFILSVLCKVCERSFFTVLTPDNWFNGQSTSSRKRKQEEKEYNTGDYSETDYQSSSTSLLTCGEEFSRFCLSHAFQHIDRGNLLQSCNLSVRIIDITNSVKCLSPINLMSYSAALLFSLYECRNLLFYFRKYYGSSFHLFKNAKNHFKNLFVDALFNL